MYERKRLFLHRIPLARGHGAGEAVSRLYPRRHVALFHQNAGDPARQIPIRHGRRAFRAIDLPAGQVAEAVGRHDDTVFDAVFEIGGEAEPVVHFLAVNVAVFAVKALYGRFDHQKHLIDQMHPPIQHHAAAPCPFLAPRAGNAVAAHDAGFDEIRLARQLVIYDVFDGEIIVVPAAVLMNLENHARFFRRVVHFLRFFDAHADRLFANNVFARFGGRLHVRRVHVVGRCDQHRVHRFVRPDLFGAFIGLVPRFFPGCGAFRVDIVNPDNLDGGLGSAFGIALQTPCMISAHAAVTDNDNLHNENLRTYIDIFVL